MASTTEDVVVRYRADVDQLEKELDGIILKQKEIVDLEKKGNTEAQKNVSSEAFAARKRKDLVKAELSELQKLRQLRKLAFDPKQISDYNSRINESKNKIALLRGEMGSFGKTSAAIFSTIGIGIAAAFSVSSALQFQKAAVNAFLEAESSATKLRFAITTLGGESVLAFDRLVKQSNDLQAAFGISDEAIQSAQASLAAFGLSSQQIEKAIPILTDFAAVTGQDITSAAQQLGSGLEGVGREFKKYGIEVSAAATRTENLNTILSGLAKFQGTAAEEASTLTGELRRQAAAADELQESIGEQLAPTFTKLRRAALEALQAVVDSFRGIDALRRDSEKKATESLAARVEADLVAQAQVRNITLLEQAQREQITVEEQLQKKRTEIADIELKADVTKPASERLINLRKQNEELTKTSKILADIILLETDRARVEASQAAKEAAEKETEARKKALEDLKKLQEEERKEIEKNIDLLAKLRDDAIEDDKQRRIAAFEKAIRDLTAQGQLRGAIILEMERALVKDLNKIDEQRNVDPLFRIPGRDTTIPDQLTPRDPGEAPDAIAAVEAQEEANKRSQEALLATSVSFIAELNSLYNTFTDAQVDRINREKDAKLDQISLEEQAIDQALQNRLITSREAEIAQADLLKKRVEAEDKAAKKIREIKRKQAILDKAAALIAITINTAQGVSKAIAETGVLAPAVASLIGALGALQAAIVVAQPIPYKKGSKSTRAGLSLVGEEGPELMMMPEKAKILPAGKTRLNSKIIDAMYDNRLEDYVNKHYVTPALIAQKRAFDSEKQESFAENIAKSAALQTGLDPMDMLVQFGKLRKSGTPITNVDELAAAIARELRANIQRR